MNNKGGAGKLLLIILILAVLGAAIYFTFFFTYTCDDLACFKSHQEKCSRTKYINDAEETTWLYEIKGKEDGKCEINVKVLQIKSGTIDRKNLQGKSMDCLLVFGNINSPEADISKCHGLLKEELQGLIINKLHAYVVENVGEIGGELQGIIPAGNDSS